MENQILVSNIQRFSIHDGPGIRTTVFLMGCALHCPWCANPENMQFEQSIEFDANRCVARDNNCFEWPQCPILKHDELSTLKKVISWTEQCISGALQIRGRYYQPECLYEEIMKDSYYYKDGGGVTFSGGEPLLQSTELLPVVQKLRDEKIDICFETSLCVPIEKLQVVFPYFSRAYVDIKIADQEMMHGILGGNIEQYKQNLYCIMNSHRDIIIRFPIVPGMTDTEWNLLKVREILKEVHVEKLEIFSVHNLAEGKYKAIGKKFTHYDVASPQRLQQIKDFFLPDIKSVEIIKL